MDLQALTQQVMGRIFVELEASARHVHLTKEQAQKLFGHSLTPQRELSQPGQFLAAERVTVVGPKGEFSNVAVLGPERPGAQVEISLTDARALGLQPPVRLSGDTKNTPGAVLVGPMGRLELNEGVIVAQRHIHANAEDAARLGIKDGQRVRLQTFTQRPVIFDDVPVRVHPGFQTRVHLDFDEANACGFQKGDLGRILS